MKKIIILSFITLLLPSCLNMAIYSDMDKSKNFVSFKTYAWAKQKHVHIHKNQNFDNDIVVNNIMNYVNIEFAKRNISLDTTNPDIIVDYDIMAEKKTRQEDVPLYRKTYNYWGYNPYRPYAAYNTNNWNYNVGYKTITIPYKEGTLIIDVIEAKTNQLIWKSWAICELTDPQSFENELPTDIKQMFKNYPIQISK